VKHVYGIIGAGMIGDAHISSIQKDGRASVKWVNARSEKTVEAKKAKFGIANGSTDYKAILADKEVTAVVIATPPYLHKQQAIEALQAGKHVLLEKPSVTTAADMQALLAEEKMHPSLVICDCSCRHSRLAPKFIAVRDLLSRGVLGEVFHIRQFAAVSTTFVEYNPSAAYWANDPAMMGHPILDWGVYDLSFHLGLFDDKPQIKDFSSQSWSSKAGGRYDAMLMKFDTGLSFSYERGGAIAQNFCNQTMIFGSKATLTVDYHTWGNPIVKIEHLKQGGAVELEEIKVNCEGYDDGLALIKHFNDCLEGKAKPAMPLSLAAKHLDILFKNK
jgi:predicted dehydrogenase